MEHYELLLLFFLCPSWLGAEKRQISNSRKTVVARRMTVGLGESNLCDGKSAVNRAVIFTSDGGTIPAGKIEEKEDLLFRLNCCRYCSTGSCW